MSAIGQKRTTTLPFINIPNPKGGLDTLRSIVPSLRAEAPANGAVASAALDLPQILEHGLRLLQEPSQQPTSRHLSAQLLIGVAGLQTRMGQQIRLGRAKRHGLERFAWRSQSTRDSLNQAGALTIALGIPRGHHPAVHRGYLKAMEYALRVSFITHQDREALLLTWTKLLPAIAHSHERDGGALFAAAFQQSLTVLTEQMGSGPQP